MAKPLTVVVLEVLEHLQSSALAAKDSALAARIDGILRQALEARAGELDEGELARELAERVDALLVELYRAQNEYQQLRELIDAAERRAAEEPVTRLRERLRALCAARMGRVREDFKREHSAFTNVSDVGRRAKLVGQRGLRGGEQLFNRLRSHFDPGWRDHRAFAVSDTDEQQALALEERVVLRHFAEDELKGELETVVQQAVEEVDAIWAAVDGELRLLLARMEGAARHLPASALRPTLQLPVDLSTMVGGHLLASTTLATAVLAAGWHTLAWSVAHLFVPMAVVAAAIYFVVAVQRREQEQAARLAELEKQLKERLDQFEVAIEGRMAPFFRDHARERGQELRRQAVELRLGPAQKRDYDELVGRLEQLQQHLAELHGTRMVPAQPSQALAQAGERLAQGDRAAAALLAAVAFEGGLIAWGEAQQALGGPAREGLLYELIEALHARGACDARQRRELHALRRERNRFIHSLAAVLVHSSSLEVVRSFIGRCEQHVPTLQRARA